MTAQVKHPQSILTVDLEFLEKAHIGEGWTWVNRALRYREFCEAAKPYVSLRQRNALETNIQQKQILPYGVFVRGGGRLPLQVAIYQRMEGVGESRLAKAFSIGFAGHLDKPDAVWVAADQSEIDAGPEAYSVLDVAASITKGYIRELNQEVKFTANLVVPEDGVDVGPIELTLDQALVEPLNLEIDLQGYINDNQGEYKNGKPPVGMNHMALVTELHLKDGVEIDCREEELEFYGWMTFGELEDSDLFEKLEPWSKIALKAFRTYY